MLLTFPQVVLFKSRSVATSPQPVQRDADIMGGATVFAGTRVPVLMLFDYLAAGDPLDEFLEDFPSVERAQAIAALELAKALLDARGAAVPPFRQITVIGPTALLVSPAERVLEHRRLFLKRSPRERRSVSARGPL